MERNEIKRQREIARWESELKKPKKNGYFGWLIFVICLIYTTDEVTSQIGFLMKPDIANDLFAKFGNISVGIMELVSTVVITTCGN